MARWGNVDYSDFVALRDRLHRLLQLDLDAFCMQIVKELAKDTFDILIETTPKDTSTLVNAWAVTNVTKHGDTYEVEIINPMEYAEYVEFGHRTANHTGWVPGKFMLTLAERDLQRNMQKVIKRKLEALLQEVIGG